MQKKRLDELDVLRALAFILVVAQHILGGYAWREGVEFYDSIILNLFYVVAKPAVPIFIVIVAITLLYSTKDRKLDVLKFYTKKVKFIVMPYIIWSFVIILLNNDLEMFDSIIGVLLTGNAAYHLWYMGMILRVFLYFPIILPLINKVRKQTKAVRSVLLILFCILYWLLLKNSSNVTASVASFLFIEPTELELKFVTVTPVFSVIYLALGLKIVFNYDKFIKYISTHKMLIVSIYTFLLGYAYYDELKMHVEIRASILAHNSITYFHDILYISYLCISVVVFYILSLYISSKKDKLYNRLRYMAHYSYSGYLIHTVVLDRVANIVTQYIPASLISGLISFCITVYLSIKLPHLLSYLPYCEYFLGTKRIGNKFKEKIVFTKSM